MRSEPASEAKQQVFGATINPVQGLPGKIRWQGNRPAQPRIPDVDSGEAQTLEERLDATPGSFYLWKLWHPIGTQCSGK